MIRKVIFGLLILICSITVTQAQKTSQSDAENVIVLSTGLQTAIFEYKSDKENYWRSAGEVNIDYALGCKYIHFLNSKFGLTTSLNFSMHQLFTDKLKVVGPSPNQVVPYNIVFDENLPSGTSSETTLFGYFTPALMFTFKKNISPISNINFDFGPSIRVVSQLNKEYAYFQANTIDRRGFQLLKIIGALNMEATFFQKLSPSLGVCFGLGYSFSLDISQKLVSRNYADKIGLSLGLFMLF